jgi:hypothetical protein
MLLKFAVLGWAAAVYLLCIYLGVQLEEMKDKYENNKRND